MAANIFTYGVRDIIRRLGQEHRPGGGLTSDNWRIRYVEDLIADSGFPQPVPFRDRAAKLTREVQPRSRWLVEAVDSWFDGLMPASAVEAKDRAAQTSAANDMDDRAMHLQLVKTGHLAGEGAAA